ncbi:MAG: VTT domain-containing protein [Candidatus Omnitrophica bacterium]|nr:VTT domain-containing protein [Candidatus Omnitrophota bacterium]MBU1871643.1 VTT domain-containing protein [Candidatus Omnitrophota bacterium]
MDSSSEPKGRFRQRFAILLLFLIIIGISNYYLRIDLERIRFFLEGFSPWLGALIFAFIYVLATIFLPLSKDILKVVAAVYLGFIFSSLGIWIAEIVNAVLFFHLARYLGRKYVEKRLKGRARAIDEKISSSGFKGILILRLIPLVPYRAMDLLVGLTSFSFIQYFVIVVIGSPLRIMWIQYVLAGVGIGVFKNPALLVNFMAENKLAFIWSTIYLIAVIIVAFRLKFKKRI